MLLSAPGMKPAKDAEAEALGDLCDAVKMAASRLRTGSPWSETLAVLGEELELGQPFFFKLDLASSSRSINDTPVVVE